MKRKQDLFTGWQDGQDKNEMMGKKHPVYPVILLFSFLLCLQGCMVGPNYVAPEVDVADGWQDRDEEIVADAPLCDWWKVFDDSLLTKYIEKASENNRDVLTAQANIVQARASRMVTAAAWYPRVDGSLNGGEFRFSKNGLVFGPAVAKGENPQATGLFNLLFDAVWELDLFGKTARGVQAADAQIDSSIENLHQVLISVMGEIARNYVEIRGAQQNVRLIEENISLLEQQAQIIQKQLQFGYVSLLNYEMIQAQLATARAALPDVIAEVYRGIYAISVLTGDVPETLLDELMPKVGLPKVPETVAVGLRSDLIRRRPDVRMAERQLAVATANVGVAVANFFPSFAFGAVGGLQSLHLDNLFSGSSNIWGYGGDVSVPIFKGGKLVGNYRVSEAEMQAQFQTYQQTVLKALEETETALMAFTQEKATAREYEKAEAKYEQLAELSKQRYEKGLTNKLDYLNSEINLVSAEQSLLRSEISTLIDLVTLYKALGGGWESVTSSGNVDCD